MFYVIYVQATFEKVEDEVIRFIKNIGRPNYEDMETGRLISSES